MTIVRPPVTPNEIAAPTHRAPDDDAQALIEEARLARRTRLRRRRRLMIIVVLVVAAVLAGWGAGVPPFGPTTTNATPSGSIPGAGNDSDVVAPTGSAIAFTPPPNFSDVSCPTRTVCWAVGTADLNQGIGLETSLLYRTSNHGATWHKVGMPAIAGNLGTGSIVLACPTSSTCVATAIQYSEVHRVYASRLALVSTHDAGRHWIEHLVTARKIANNVSLSCPSAARCLVVAGGKRTGRVFTTTDGGLRWRQLATLPGLPDGPQVACPTTRQCTVVQAAYGSSSYAATTHDFGTTWSLGSIAGGVGTLSNLTCPSASTCTALGSPDANRVILVETHDGGRTWVPLPAQSTTFNTGQFFEGAELTCPAVRHCILTADGPPGLLHTYTTTDGFDNIEQRTSSDLTASLPDALSCSAGLSCVGVGFGGSVMRTAGKGGWDRLPLRAFGTYVSPSAIACSSASSCRIAGSAGQGTSGGATVLSTTDAGRTWHRSTVSTLGNIEAMSCPTANRCIALAQAAEGSGLWSARSADGGRTWSTPVPFPATANVSTNADTLSCPTASVCYASLLISGNGGQDTAVPAVEKTTDGGLTWDTLNTGTTPTDGEAGSLACPTESWCVLAFDSMVPRAGGRVTFKGVAAVTRDGGRTWRQTALPVAAVFTGFTCQASGLCLLDGITQQQTTERGPMTHTELVGSTDHGATWKLLSIMQRPAGLSFACPSAGNCWAAGWDGWLYHSTDGGRQWDRQRYFSSKATMGMQSNSDQTLLACTTTTCWITGNVNGTTYVFHDRAQH